MSSRGFISHMFDLSRRLCVVTAAFQLISLIFHCPVNVTFNANISHMRTWTEVIGILLVTQKEIVATNQ